MNRIQFVPIAQTIEENYALAVNPAVQEILTMTVAYYLTIGFNPPWIGYFARFNGELAGSGGFKGKPVDHQIEIAYGIFPDYRSQGIGTLICRELVLLAQRIDPTLIITARTLPEPNYSNRILQKNGFHFQGNVWDQDDGEVWEWVYAPQAT